MKVSIVGILGVTLSVVGMTVFSHAAMADNRTQLDRMDITINNDNGGHIRGVKVYSAGAGVVVEGRASHLFRHHAYSSISDHVDIEVLDTNGARHSLKPIGVTTRAGIFSREVAVSASDVKSVILTYHKNKHANPNAARTRTVKGLRYQKNIFAEIEAISASQPTSNRVPNSSRYLKN